jgi:DNA-binding LacI/PurR family transcriptional regulator
MPNREQSNLKKRTRSSGSPKYLQFAEQVRKQVRVGDLKPGDRLPSLSEARDQWGLGRSTLERAHALLEKDGLIERHHGRGTFITSPKRATTGCIGFWRNTSHQAPSYPYWTHLIEGMQEAASKAGMEVLLFNPQVDAIRWTNVDAFIALANDFTAIRHLIPAAIPCVSVINRAANIPSVVADEYSGVQNAVHHLVSLGHRRIGYLTLTHSVEAPLRLAAYQAALREYNIRPESEWIRNLTGGDAEASVSFVEIGRQSMGAWLKAGFAKLGCTALLTQNDETALGAIEVLRKAGYRVPDDISIVGFDGTEVAEYCSPPLTTIVMPLHEMGSKAVELALQISQGETGHTIPQTTTLPTVFKVRETTAVPHDS